jgi:hypothetical protein
MSCIRKRHPLNGFSWGMVMTIGLGCTGASK